MFRRFPHYKQLDSMDCGPACLKMVAKHYGRSYTLPFLREKCYIDRAGVSFKGISEAAEFIGLRTTALYIPLHSTPKEETPSLSNIPLPAIVHWNQNHFIVVYKVTAKKVYVADPASDLTEFSIEEFNKAFCSKGDKGFVLAIQTTPDFNTVDTQNGGRKGVRFLLQYLKPHRKLLIQLIIGLCLGTIFQLILPFLTQSLVDIGVGTQNLTFIYLVLIGQLFLFLGQTVVRFIQSWILLHIGVRINTGLIADFLVKLMKLPLSFFDSKNTGDLLQRIDDHRRIEHFLTESLLSIVLSIITLLVFGMVLAFYSISIFLVFLFSSIFYTLWVFLFLGKRRNLDHKVFQELSNNRDSLLEIIHGMPEIKLQGSELKRRWQWTSIQAKLFRLQVKILSVSQYQDIGALSVNQLKDIIISIISATAVVNGEITLGMMLAIQYIIGSLNSPLQQLIGFIRASQDAAISLERLSEIHINRSEENTEEQKMDVVPPGDIVLENVSFQYTPISGMVLSDVSIRIPRGKTTAIVGTSGSGKTTLMKLLLGFYQATEGYIYIGSTQLDNIYKKVWRSKCGAVMQDGFIFSDTIANNIAESDEQTDFKKVVDSGNTANIFDFIQRLPLGLNTMIGPKGNGISQGQKQRLLIARAVYKNPEFLFLDEATNSLDTNNERTIMHNLDDFLKGRTSIIVAHRLSTVKNADQIIVLEKGRVVETGTHEQLVIQKGNYYNLVQNQLELGN